MNIVVYTCITGGKDQIKPLSSIEDGIDYVCFTDDPSGDAGEAWEMRPAKLATEFDKTRQARYHKIMAHEIFKKHDVSVWIDGNIDIRVCIRPLVENWLRFANMAMFAHPEGRKCIYQEHKVCTRLKKDQQRAMDRQIARYRADGYPECIGLSMTGVLVRRHKAPDVIRCMSEWWNEILNGSIRDQLSFNYVAWKQRFPYVEIQEFFLDRMFDIRRHAINIPIRA